MKTSKTGLQYTDASRLTIHHESIETQQVVDGDVGVHAVTTGFSQLSQMNGCDIGIWEMSVGTMTDIETDEYFVVLSGRGTVDVLAKNGFAPQTQKLAAGAVVRLHAGMHTVWTVDETLRKVYFAPSE